MNIKSKEQSDTLLDKLGKWYNILLFMVVIGTGVGNFMLSNYRHGQHDKNIEKLGRRIEKVESINYELLAQQLQDIQTTNNELMQKIDKTNERVDKVLELLVSNK